MKKWTNGWVVTWGCFYHPEPPMTLQGNNISDQCKGKLIFPLLLHAIFYLCYGKGNHRLIQARFRKNIHGFILGFMSGFTCYINNVPNHFSSWCFQPLWKIISQNGNPSQIGVKIKHVWNHHPVLLLQINHRTWLHRKHQQEGLHGKSRRHPCHCKSNNSNLSTQATQWQIKPISVTKRGICMVFVALQRDSAWNCTPETLIWPRFTCVSHKKSKA